MPFNMFKSAPPSAKTSVPAIDEATASAERRKNTQIFKQTIMNTIGTFNATQRTQNKMSNIINRKSSDIDAATGKSISSINRSNDIKNTLMEIANIPNLGEYTVKDVFKGSISALGSKLRPTGGKTKRNKKSNKSKSKRRKY
jgi:hypothetical protein